jgi:hypothetical protein
MNTTEMHASETVARQISSIEGKWLHALYRQCRSHFDSVHLPSHDHFHHYRVWFYAKELILTLSETGIHFPDHLIEEIMFAIFFHDVGMSVTLDENHGKVSADLFRGFISGRLHQTEANRESILEAIAHHDRKNYENVPFENALSKSNILRAILNISDDLDAFGDIGTYRYLEIYLLRDIQPEHIAGRVLPNLERRFTNMAFTLHKIDSFVNSHRARYHRTCDFFNDLKNSRYVPDGPLTGPSGIVRLIKEHVIDKTTNLYKLFESLDKANQDEYIRNHLQGFQNEEDHFLPLYPAL